jgi:poly-gamma-glutamate capsule biosynthesis protein CapA/YwtB (metallophosphatase superfamily)
MNLRQSLLVFVAALCFTACQEAPVTYKQPIHHHKKIKAVIPTATATSTTSPTTQPDSICIAAVGDIMLGTSYPDKKTLPPDSAKNSFKNVTAELRDADVTFGNLEGTLLDTGSPANYRLHQLIRPWLFRMPASYGKVLKDAGFNVLSLANNHIGDFGDFGRISTMKVLDSLGIYYGGQLSHPSAVFKINRVTYGFCAFAPNGETLSILDLKHARYIIQNLKKQCDIVMVSFHGGGEGIAFEHVPFLNEVFINEKRGDVLAFAHNAIDAGADLVFGNGPHVCRAMEIYKNRLIAYSLGNFCTYRSVSVAGICGMAPLLKVYVNKKGKFLGGRIIANKQTRDKGLEPDSLNRVITRIKMLTETDFPESGLSISDAGIITPVKE